MGRVPDYVKQYWSELLGCQNGSGKSTSAVHTLVHTWPRDTVGWHNKRSGKIIPYDEKREEELGKPMSQAITAEEAMDITPDQVLEAERYALIADSI